MKRLPVIGLFIWACMATLWLAVLVSRPQQGSNQCQTEPSAFITQVIPGPADHVIRAEEHDFPEVESEVAQQAVIDKQTPDVLQKYYSEIFRVGIDLKSEKCTMVMLTYKRIKTLPDVLTHYCKVRLLEKILVIWNDVDTPVPQNLLELSKSCETKLQFIREKENRLSNRFKPRPEIETECVLNIDDDRKIEDLHNLEIAFLAWQEFRHRIVGFEFRTCTMTPQGSYFYGVYKGTAHYPGNCIMLTSTCLLHKTYLKMFHDANVLPRKMFDYIDKEMNCEDIGINMMVAKFLTDVNVPQPCLLSVKYKGQITNLEGAKGGYTGLSRRSDHYKLRSDCVNKFVADYFGGNMPLRYTYLFVTV